MSFKSDEKKSSSTQNSTTTPSSFQLPYLNQAFQAASNAFGKASGATSPTDFTAGFTPDQLGAFQKMLDYGMSPSSAATGATNAGTALTGAGTGAVTSGLDALNGFTPDAIASNNINAANRYVAGQDIPAQVDAAMLDARRNANENLLPGIDRAAAGSGNINSSRTAIERGVVDRGLAEKAGALSAELRANAFNNGLNLGQQGNNSAISAALGRVNGGNSAVGTGVTAGAGGLAQQAGLFDIANSAINSQHTAAQDTLTNEEQQYQHQVNDPFAALVNFYNIIGNRPWGSTTNSTGTTTQTSTPSGMSVLGGIVSGIGSMFAPIQLPIGK